MLLVLPNTLALKSANPYHILCPQFLSSMTIHPVPQSLNYLIRSVIFKNATITAQHLKLLTLAFIVLVR